MTLPVEILTRILSYNIIPITALVCKELYNIEESLQSIRVEYLDILYDCTIDQCIDDGNRDAVFLMLEQSTYNDLYKVDDIFHCGNDLYYMLPQSKKYLVATLIHLYEKNQPCIDDYEYLDMLAIWGDMSIIEHYVYDTECQSEELEHICICAQENGNNDMANSLIRDYGVDIDIE
jgi:hypothetical protein